jgi:ATP-binding cassette, subfamily B, bacterial PglK
VNNQRSFINFCFQSFQLLHRAKWVRFVKLISLSIVLAGVEIISLALFFPLLQELLYGGNTEAGSSLLSIFKISNDSIHWMVLPIFIVCLFLIKNVFAIWLTHSQLKFLDQLYLDFAKEIYVDFYKQSWASYTQKDSAESFRQIKNTTYEYTHTVLQGFLAVIPELFVCILITTCMAWINIKILFLFAAFFIPIFLFYLVFKKKVIAKVNQSFREQTPRTNIVLSQGIDSFAEAKIYAKENYFIDSFLILSKITTRQLSKLKTFINLPVRLTEIAGVLCFASAIMYSKMFSVSRPDFLLLLVLTSLVIYRIIPSVNRILFNLSQIQAYSYATFELHGILTHSRKIDFVIEKEIAFNSYVEVRSLSFQYENISGHPLFRSLNCRINKGDFIVIEGTSGAGKTTLLYILAGLIDNYQGQISVDDSMLTSENIDSWRSILGFVPQSPIILHGTFLQNIAFGIIDDDISIHNANEALKFVGLNSLIDSFPLGINTQIGENGLTLSGGQRQRLALARALYRNPEILLLDEVTNQLDDDSKFFLLRNIQLLNKEGKTIVMITHDSEAKHFANRILSLKNGTLEEMAS